MTRVTYCACAPASREVNMADLEDVTEEQLEALRNIISPNGICELPNTALDVVLDKILIGEK